MKLGICLVISAIAVASTSAASSDDCAFACPDVDTPVCGSDGKTYSNKCYLSLASCKSNNSITQASDGECAATPSPSPSPSTTTTYQVGSDHPNCPDACLDQYEPVTDENGKTYSNECYMNMAKCQNNKATDPSLTLRNFD